MKRTRTISEEGLKLFNLSLDDLEHRKTQLKKNKNFLQSILFDIFTTEYDINLLDTVKKLKNNCYKLYSNIDYKNTKLTSTYINNAITNIVLSILTYNGEIANYQQSKNNYYYFLDIAKKAFNEKDDHTCIVIYSAVSTLCLNRLKIKLRKKDRQLFKQFGEKYGTFKNSFRTHLNKIMESKNQFNCDNTDIHILPSIMILLIHLKKAKEYSSSFKSLGQKCQQIDIKRLELIKILSGLKNKYADYQKTDLLDLYTDIPEENPILKNTTSDNLAIQLIELGKMIPSPKKRTSCFF
jgi:hypothetical protein